MGDIEIGIGGLMGSIRKPRSAVHHGITESEYKRLLDEISSQVDTAIESFYTERAINQIASEQHAVIFKLNLDAAFWNLVLYCLQSTFFMTLGRIFDEGSETFSIHKFLSITVGHPEFFSKSALRSRKIGLSHGMIPDWLDSYMENVWEPTTSDLKALKKAIAPFSKKFNSLYRPIRNKVFGHILLMDDQLKLELFNKIQIKEIDEIFCFLRDLIGVLSDLFLNGKKPEFGNGQYDDKERIRENVQSVLFDLSRIRT